MCKKKIANIVIFTGGKAPAPEKTANYWNSPLVFRSKKEPNFVIAADSGLETLHTYQEYFGNFTPNLILGDFDSISDTKILARYPDEIIEKVPSYKDLTDTELALKAAKKRFGHGAFITLVGGTGGRTDHFLGIYDLFGSKTSPDAWLCEEQVLFNAHHRKFFVEGLALGAPISVARAASMPKCFPISWCIKTRGLEWESDVFRKRGMPSISNTISLKHFNEKRPVEFDFKRGKFVLILPLEAKVSIKI